MRRLYHENTWPLIRVGVTFFSGRSVTPPSPHPPSADYIYINILYIIYNMYIQKIKENVYNRRSSTVCYC